MDLLTSSLLCPLLIWLLLQAFNSIINGSKSSQQKLPPGPRRMPIIGNLIDLGDKPHRSLAKLAQIHGPVMTCQHHEVGLTWIPVSPLWRTLRKVCNTHVFASMKLDATQYLRRNKIQELIANVGESCHKGEAIKIGQAVFDTTINLLFNTIFSVDLADPNSSSAQEFRKIVCDIMVEAGEPNLANYFPLLKKIDPKGVRRWMTVHFNKLLNLFGNMFDERRQSRQSQDYSVSNDVLDTLLDIIEGGIEKLSKIIVTNLLLESDINRLPYLQAIIKETFRMHPAVPLDSWGSEIDVKGKDFGLIPFGAGRRICPRLLLANRMLHLILGYPINCFDWELEGEISPNEMNMKEKYGIAVQMVEPLLAILILV
ncbi:hypothetical protein ES319_D09G208600v1 [Gossypium barbadense]|uniref:Cytochrome P450 n=1 Tax=Gossypium barbadense TaxID=3634 RepID=A0A5J5Q7G6_GOSBA|nr:hypothetical protein ES319_D09G208600v1 [Gossypium barbadense]